MKRADLRHYLIIAAALLLIVSIALWLRIALPYPQVFTDNWIKFTGVDAYYYMRLTDNLAKHFPQLTLYDPYYRYPAGLVTGTQADFFTYLLAGAAWLFGMGQPDQHTVDVISAFIPPLLAAMTVIAVFFIGRAVGGAVMGLFAAGLLAIIPGEFLNRSLLGYTDHHIAEVLFSTAMMLFLFEYVHRMRDTHLTDTGKGEVAGQVKSISMGILAGICLWLYLLTWQGASMFIVIVILFVVVQGVIDHVRGISVGYLGVLGISVFGAALLLCLPWANSMTLTMLGIGVVVSVLLVALSAWFKRKQVKVIYYPLGIGFIGLVMLGLFWLVSPGTLQALVGYAVAILGWQPGTTVIEMQPLLLQQGQFTFMIAFGNFLLAFLVSLIGLGILVCLVIKKSLPVHTLLLVWSIFILLATLGMRRFAYYYAVNVALLSGYVCWISVKWAAGSMKKKKVREQTVPSRKLTKKQRAAAVRPVPQRVSALLIVSLLLIALVVYYPNLGPLPGGERPAPDLASRPAFAPTDSWCQALDWLRENSPEPFGRAEAYYGYYRSPGQQGGFVYPDSTYSVLAWWDYGYMINRIGRRVPVSNPGSGNMGEAMFFTAQDEETAASAIRGWRTKYVIVDAEIARYDSKFHALAKLSGGQFRDYIDVALAKRGDQLAPMLSFHPEFYRSMVARLYFFDGQQVVPENVTAVRVKERTADDGQKVNEIVETRQFLSYEKAEQHMREQSSKDWQIIGYDPGVSAVPLEPLKDYQLVFKSKRIVSIGSKTYAAIKIFEKRIPGGGS